MVENTTDDEKTRLKIAAEKKIRSNLEKVIRKKKWKDNKTNNNYYIAK